MSYNILIIFAVWVIRTFANRTEFTKCSTRQTLSCLRCLYSVVYYCHRKVQTIVSPFHTICVTPLLYPTTDLDFLFWIHVSCDLCFNFLIFWNLHTTFLSTALSRHCYYQNKACTVHRYMYMFVYFTFIHWDHKIVTIMCFMNTWTRVSPQSLIWKIEKYQGVFGVKSRVKTWQNRGIWSQQLEHKQVLQWETEPGVRKGKRSLLACHTRWKCSMETTHNRWRSTSVSRSWNWWKVWLVGKSLLVKDKKVI